MGNCSALFVLSILLFGVGLSAHADPYGKLPLSFVENRGGFVISGPEGSAAFTESGVRFRLKGFDGSNLLRGLFPLGGKALEEAAALPGDSRGIDLRVSFLEADSGLRLEGAGELPGKVNSFVGKDPLRWKSNIATYSGVAYRGVWPGIDVLYRGEGRRLKYDILVAPGADPGKIKLRYEGADRLSLAKSGDLRVYSGAGCFQEAKPGIYQEKDGERVWLDGGFAVDGDVVSFRLPGYDPALPLVIDPASDLAWSTFLGGSGIDQGYGIAVDSDGCAYVVTKTDSSSFPVTEGVYDTSFNSGTFYDAVVTKLNASGTALVYSTFLGGSMTENPYAICVDSNKRACIAGSTSSTDYPTTTGAYQESSGGSTESFVTKLNASGSGLVYSTYLGGSDIDVIYAMATDSSGNAYVAGKTASVDFPVTAEALQTTRSASYDGFITKLNSTGSGLVYSTFLGGTATDEIKGIAVDSNGCAYVAGRTGGGTFPATDGAFCERPFGASYDAFAAKLNADGWGLYYSTFLGGTGSDDALCVAVDSAGCAYVGGGTASSGITGPPYPTTAGAFSRSFAPGNQCNGFVTKLNVDGSALAYSTFVGGAGDRYSSINYVRALAVDSLGNVCAVGDTNSATFPTTADAYDTTRGSTGSSSTDAFVVKLNAAGSALGYGSYLGGSLDSGAGSSAGGVAIDGRGGIFVTGYTYTSDFPTSAGAFDTSYGGDKDVFVSKLSLISSTTYASPDQFVKDGWNLVSVPADPVNGDPVSVLSGIDVPNSSLVYWKNDVGAFQLYGSSFGWTGPIVRGLPYWFLQSGGSKTLSFQGIAPATDFTLTFPAHAEAPYWVMFGTPFAADVACASVTFLNSSVSSASKNWSQAYGLGMVEPKALGFDAAARAYFTAGAAESLPDRSVLQPWYGYWLLVNHSGTLSMTFPKP